MNNTKKYIGQIITFLFLICSGCFFCNQDTVYAEETLSIKYYDDDTASSLESTYTETHTAKWSGAEAILKGADHAAKWDAKSQKLIVVGADAYAVPMDTYEVLTDKNNKKKKLPRERCTNDGKPTKRCQARCYQDSGREDCKSKCAVSTVNTNKSCPGHGWSIAEIKDEKHKTIRDCTSTVQIDYTFVQLYCNHSDFPCFSTVWICYFTVTEVEADHNVDIRQYDDNQHEYWCRDCGKHLSYETHLFGEWTYTSSTHAERECLNCGYKQPMTFAEPADGLVTYKANYPSGTTHGPTKITDTYTYYPPTTTYDVTYETTTATKAGTYAHWYKKNGSWTYVNKKLKKGETYCKQVNTPKTDYHEKDNRYKVKDKFGSVNATNKFWAYYSFSYAANDASGSTKAHNIPSKDIVNVTGNGFDPAVGKYVTYKSQNDKIVIDASWKAASYKAAGRGSIYREGYILNNWKNSAWGGATWGLGEKRSSLPNGAALKNSVLRANWSNEVYTINYNSNKPGNASHDPSYVAPTKVTFDKKTNELPTPSLTGWTFVGWYTNSNGTGDGTIRLSDYEGRNWTFDPKPTTGENSTIQAYAHWIANTYTVNLLTNRPSISIQDLYRVNGNTFASGGTGWTWNSAGYYSSTFTYDSTSYLPSPSGVYGMTGWTPTANWYWYRNDSTEPYVSAMVGIGYASWNLTPVNGGIVGIYEGWTDNDPNTSGEQDPNYPDPDNGDPINQLKLRADGNNTTRWYASAGKDWYNNANPYVTRLLTLPDGKQYTWGSTWANEDIDLNLWAQDYGTGISTIQMIIDQYPSSAAQAMSTWSTSRGQNASALSMERTDIYNGTTKLHGWSKDYSSKQSTTQQMTVKIDKNAPRKVYVTRTTGTIEAPLSGDGNPYVGNPSYDDYKYGGALIDEAEMCTTFTATVDDRDDTLYDNRDVAGVVMVWVDVWDTEDNSNVKSYRMDLDTSKTFIRNAENSAYAYGNYNVTANLYKDFPSAANLYYKISAADAAGNLRVLYDSSKDTTGSDYPLDKGSSDDKPLSTPNKDNTGDGSTGVIIRNISIHTWITRDDTSEEACYVTVTDPSGVKKKVPVSDNFFLGGQNGTVHIDTYGYVDEVEIRYPTEAGSGASVTLSGTTYTSTYGDMLLAAWYDQRRGLTTGRLDAELIFNDHGGTYAGDGTETDLRYTTEESGVTKTETKNLPGISGNGYCQRYYAYNFRMPLYINEVLAKASDWSYNNQVYNAKTFVTVQTARKYGTGNSAVGTAIARSESYAKCGTVGDGNDTKLTDTFHTILYR